MLDPSMEESGLAGASTAAKLGHKLGEGGIIATDVYWTTELSAMEKILKLSQQLHACTQDND